MFDENDFEARKLALECAMRLEQWYSAKEEIIIAAEDFHAFLTGQKAAAPEKPVPAVPVEESVTPEFIICLENGRNLKMLKRHLRTAYNMTPDEYRAKWGLAADYPMVAPNYAAERSEYAKSVGLGRKGRGGNGIRSAA